MKFILLLLLAIIIVLVVFFNWAHCMVIKQIDFEAKYDYQTTINNIAKLETKGWVLKNSAEGQFKFVYKPPIIPEYLVEDRLPVVSINVVNNEKVLVSVWCSSHFYFQRGYSGLMRFHVAAYSEQIISFKKRTVHFL